MADDATQTATPPAAAPPPPPQIDTDTPQVSATVPDVQQPTQAAPTVLIPEKKGGLAGIVQEFRDAVAGSSGSQTYIDPTSGERYVQHTPLTSGQQWARIGETALRGAAAGLENGQGRGGSMRAAGAGINAGLNEGRQNFEKQDEAAEQDFERERQAKLDRANDQINTAKLVAAQFANTRMQTKGTQEDIDWSDTRAKNLETGGARLVGTAQNVGDLAKIQREDEQDLLKNHFSANTYVTVPQYNSDGTAAGVAIYAKAPGWGQQLAPQGFTIPIFQPPDKPGAAPTRKDVTPTVPMTNDQVQSYENLYDQQMTNWQKTKAETDLKAAQTEQAGAGAVKNRAQAGEAHAAAFKDTQEGNKAQAETTNLTTGGPGGSASIPAQFASESPVNGVRVNYLNALPVSDQAIVKSIGEGRAEDVARYALSRPNSPGFRIAQEVNTAYPGFDFTRAKDYEKTRAEFTSGKQADSINALNTAMAHMETMYNSADWLTTTPIIGAAERALGSQKAADLANSKTALVDELGKAYKGGALTIEDKKSWEARINAWSPIETRNNARSFIQLLHGKLEAYENQWRNGSPPAAVAPIQFMGPAAQNAYKTIMGNAPPPQGATGKVKGSDGQWYWTDGKNNLGRVNP